MEQVMKDAYGRIIDYLRISITDRCNLRCRYCMPDGVETVLHQDILSFEEIRQIAACGAKLGIRHIKLTGGEPLVRKGCVDLVAALKAVPGIETVTLTTNGILLEDCLDSLLRAGIDGINISLDTLDRRLYRTITGQDGLPCVLQALEKAAACPVPIKINAVSVDWEEIYRRDNYHEDNSSKDNYHKDNSSKDNYHEDNGSKDNYHRDKKTDGAEANSRKETGEGKENWRSLITLAQKYPVDVRFIEMMPIGYGKDYRTINHEKLLAQMKQAFPGMTKEEKSHGFGPAVYYRIPGFLGSIGLISAIHGKFCTNCNRVRLTAQGYLKTCLCFDDGADLRAVLRQDAYQGKEQTDIFGQLTNVMEETIRKKPAAHCFELPQQITEHRNMVDIGG